MCSMSSLWPSLASDNPSSPLHCSSAAKLIPLAWNSSPLPLCLHGNASKALRCTFNPLNRASFVYCSANRPRDPAHSASPSSIPSSSSSSSVPDDASRLADAAAEFSSPSEEGTSDSADRGSGTCSSSSLPDGGTSGLPFFENIKLLKELTCRIRGPLHDIFSNASKRILAHFDRYTKPALKPEQSEERVDFEIATTPREEWDWERWERQFAFVKEQENLASILKFKLEDAIDDEDFREAARLKVVLDEAYSNDLVAEVLTELKNALENENYERAAKLRDEAAAGLVGWWIGLAEGESDPYGRIVSISAAYGRFVGKSYTARQLITASSGSHLFEVFIRKNSERYYQQAVYLQQQVSDGLEASIQVNIVDTKQLNEDGETNNEAEPFGDEKAKKGDTTLSAEKLRSIVNFLKERIPDVKLKVYRVIKQNEDDISHIHEEILEEVEVEEGDGTKGNKDEYPVENTVQEAKLKAGQGSSFRQDLPKELLERSGVEQNIRDNKYFQLGTRMPANIDIQSRDSFLLRIQDSENEQTPQDAAINQISLDAASKLSESVSDGGKISVKVSKDLEELLKLAVSQARRRRGLSKCTSFRRIELTDSSTDPLTGLYIGAFGPYTLELVQLKRKYGNWHGELDGDTPGNRMEFVEFVEAVKLTGDMNVPAGQVTFRAKIGKDSRLPHRGIFPEELGVIARYKGQGRLAEPGFKNPQWVAGELLLFDGKGFGNLNGAQLGFVYSVPEKNFLVLFNRLKLQD